jgi:hypothetical protein
MRHPFTLVLIVVLAAVVWGLFQVAGDIQACNDKGGVMTSNGQCVQPIR